jgi:hypothetical protein
MLIAAVTIGIARVASADTSAPAPVQLSPADQQRLQIVAAPLGRGEQVPRLEGYAQVLDATQFVTLVGDWQSAAAAAEASTNEAKRLALLQQDEDNASLKSVQAARAVASADQAKVRTLSARIALEWSPALIHAPAALAQRLSDGRTVLIRVEFPLVAALADGTDVSLTAPGDTGQHWIGRILSKATGTQIVGPGTAYLAATFAPELHVGQRLLANAQAGAALTGSLLPAAAVVTYASQLWCYEKTDTNHFVRRSVPPDAAAIPPGYLVATSFTSHPIVVHGASLLLSAEHASSTLASD